jgi:hypothetical protein
MAAGSKWDPDKMLFEDLDLTDHQAVMDYLNHPTTRALDEELARHFRRQPAEVQIAELREHLSNDRLMLLDLETAIERQDDPTARLGIEELRDAIQASVEGKLARIQELETFGPDT